MIATLWTICAWTGLIWWCAACIAAPCAVVMWAALGRNSDDHDLPANWGELDSYRSTEEAWAEMRRRKTDGA